MDGQPYNPNGGNQPASPDEASLPPQPVTQSPSPNKIRHCPGCGTAMVFDPETGCQKCPTCGQVAEDTEITDNSSIVENDLLHLPEDESLHEEQEELTARCPTCGAESTFPVNVVAGPCPFCKNPLVLASQSQRTIRPAGVVPFALTQDKAQAKFAEWLRSRWFLPNAAKQSCLATSLHGVYRPIWTFDFHCDVSYTGERGTYYYVHETTTVNGKTHTRRVRKTRWDYAAGSFHKFLDDLTIPGSQRVPMKRQDELSPWRLQEAVNYSEDLVRGFVEESYDIPLQTAFDAAKGHARRLLTAAAKRDIGGDEQRVHSLDVQYTGLSYKLLLAPFWESSFRFNGKEYGFFVNGQTGKASGDRPISCWKVFFFALFVLACLAGALIFLSK